MFWKADVNTVQLPSWKCSSWARWCLELESYELREAAPPGSLFHHRTFENQKPTNQTKNPENLRQYYYVMIYKTR